MRRLPLAVEAAMRGKRGVGPALFRMSMTPAAWLYGCVVKRRNRFYDRQGGERVTVPVVSVGNVSVGGTGKSDVVTLLAESLPGKVAIVSRGYGVRIGQPFVVERHGPELCGDEPYMLKQRLPQALVVVGPDRVAGAKLAIERGAQLILLDDGMQHRRLHRDFEIALLDASNPVDFLPKGLLRDEASRLEKADLTVSVGRNEKAQVILREEIEGIFTLQGEKIRNIERVPVALFCGIGNPGRFVKTVERLGAEIKRTFFVPDHKRVDEATLAKLCAGQRYLICTEKDQVKYRKSVLPILWVKRRLVVETGAELWRQALEAIGKKL